MKRPRPCPCAAIAAMIVVWAVFAVACWLFYAGSVR